MSSRIRFAFLGLISVLGVAQACGGRSLSNGDRGESSSSGVDDGAPVGDDSTAGGSGGAPTGGGMSTGGAVLGGATAMGGAPEGGAEAGGGEPTGGVGGRGGTGAGDECKGIMPPGGCRVEGAVCPNLVCGLADTGARECRCNMGWSCMPCDFSSSPFRDRPAFIPACPDDAADEVPCTVELTVCGPVLGEYCACYNDARDGLIWDCDQAPNTW